MYDTRKNSRMLELLSWLLVLTVFAWIAWTLGSQVMPAQNIQACETQEIEELQVRAVSAQAVRSELRKELSGESSKGKWNQKYNTWREK